MNDHVLQMKSIGIIRTPYQGHAPYQPVDEDEGDFRIILEPEYAEGLRELSRFNYIYVIYHIHELEPLDRDSSMLMSPSWANGIVTGVFASRSPLRPNPIGLSVVRVKDIQDNVIHTSGLDVFDGTPLLDIKPYIKDLDVKTDANYGWVDDVQDQEHMTLHIKGIPHDY